MIDTQSRQLLWQENPEGAEWWSSLTAFSAGHVYLHGYRNPEIPEPTDLLILAASTGEMIRVVPNYILVRTLNHNILEVATKQGEGFVHKEYNVDTDEITVLSGNFGDVENQIILKEPIRYKQGNAYFERLQTFIQNKTLGHVATSIDYLECKPYVIFSYYIYQQDKSVQYLLIVTDQMETVLHEKLSEGREGIGRSTMLLKASTLVYLKNNNEFSSLTLS